MGHRHPSRDEAQIADVGYEVDKAAKHRAALADWPLSISVTLDFSAML
ncbi:MAG: hypothetical protein KatS3mg008_0515 [Acidimicrobiales bacterium]|nr:MAG: hypothetical protein KatS3mg008_0515 [Acidimicrobiales bacterium]